ncbi:MAG: hypothetical protein MJ236_00830 [Clostridia bacterium]|nr:hypothetical protein [Clostridia bacterium]
MIRGTTPTLHVKILGLRTEDVLSWYITIAQDDYLLTFENDRITVDDDVLVVPITEEETLQFRDGMASIQIRAVTKSGQRIASDIKSGNIDGLLWDEVI